MKLSNEGLRSRQDSDCFVLFWAWKKSENTRERKDDWENKVLMEVVSLTHYILVEHGNQRDPSEIGQIMALLCSKLSMTFQFIQNKRQSPYNGLPYTTWSSVTAPWPHSNAIFSPWLCCKSLDTAGLVWPNALALPFSFVWKLPPQISIWYVPRYLESTWLFPSNLSDLCWNATLPFLTPYVKLSTLPHHIPCLILPYIFFIAFVTFLTYSQCLTLFSISPPLEHKVHEGMDEWIFICFVHCLAGKPRRESDTELEVKITKRKKGWLCAKF